MRFGAFFSADSKAGGAYSAVYRSRVRRDAFWLVIACAVALILAIRFDLFERVIDFAAGHESWEVDEFLNLFVITSVGGLIFSVRRLRDLDRELRQRAAAEERVRVLAMQDPLTGLPNRRHFSRFIGQRLETGEAMACLVIDLDRFKPVNDLYGHAIGDGLLVHLAGVFRAAAGEKGMAARLGGDEFAIVVPGAGRDAAAQIAESVLTRMQSPFDIEGKACQVGTSIGISLSPEDGLKTDVLMRRADIALYRAKDEGRARYCFFETGMDDRIQERARLQKELSDAVRLGQIEPYYHSLIDLASGEIEGFEVLARWNHPLRGLVPPTVFIALAEELGLISDLSCQILRQACTDARDWPSHLSLAVNISPLQLRDRWLAERILQILTETGFPADRLELEITEDALVDDVETVRNVIVSLKNQGIRIALDDFGTGYSSLQHLRDLPIDKLKIDRSFVQNARSDAESISIISAIIGLAGTLGLKVTAEGIETQENGLWLREMGCALGQGFLYGEPADVRRTSALLKEVASAKRKPRARRGRASGTRRADAGPVRRRGSA